MKKIQTSEDITTASDDELQDFILHQSQTKEIKPAARKVKTTYKNEEQSDPVAVLHELLLKDNEMAALTRDLAEHRIIPSYLKPIALFLQDCKLQEKWRESPDLVADFRAYLRKKLEKEALAILNRDAIASERQRLKTENLILSALRLTEDNVAAQKSVVSKEMYVGQTEEHLAKVAADLGAILSAEIQEEDPSPKAARIVFNPNMFAAQRNQLKASKERKLASLESTLAKKQSPATPKGVAKTKDQIKAEKQKIISNGYAE
ncbi:MAG TPA: hypothetical protein VLG38_03140, partial [Gammaproteobacteria bacterium]|nr:hypothetical protein [Gammaproteobacteria bacterium]